MFWNEGQVYLINISSWGYVSLSSDFLHGWEISLKEGSGKAGLFGNFNYWGESDLDTYLLLR